MTPEQRAQLLELLEVTHGYAMLGSIMPFRTACIDLKLQGTEVAGIAAEMIDRARDGLGLPKKPAPRPYCEAIGVTYVTHGGMWGLPAGMCVMSIQRNPAESGSAEFRSGEVQP